MGYDLYWRDQPAEVTAARDSDDWELYFTLQESHGCYWRESIWTMQRFRSLMGHLDVMTNDTTNNPDLEGTGEIEWDRFSSNDGWVITASQCDMVADALRTALQDDTGATIRSYLDGTEAGGSRDQEMAQSILSALSSAVTDDAQIAIGTGLTDNRDDDLMQASSDLLGILRFFEGAAAKGNGIVVW